MQPFEFYKLAKDNLLNTRLQQVANFLAEQNDTTSVVSIVRNLIKVDYKNNPYFNSLNQNHLLTKSCQKNLL